MNNPGPFFNPFLGFQSNDRDNYDKFNNRINYLEKRIIIIENRLNKLENNESKPKNDDEPTDMYMI